MTIKRFITGSRTFFEGMEGFMPHDADYLEIDPDLQVAGTQYKPSPGVDVYRWKFSTFGEFYDFFKIHRHPNMRLCLFLSRDVARFLGMDFEDLKKVAFLKEGMDKRHMYLVSIYDFYMENGGWFLTERQRDEAYEIYKRERINRFK